MREGDKGRRKGDKFLLISCEGCERERRKEEGIGAEEVGYEVVWRRMRDDDNGDDDGGGSGGEE